MLLLPALAGFLVLVWLVRFHGDFWVADHLYAWQGHRWQLRHHWLTETVVHRMGKQLSLLAWVGVVGLCIASPFGGRLRDWRAPLAYLATSVALSTGVISVLKHATDMDCPWDLQRYGGLMPYVDLFSTRPRMLPHGQCFPAGHASAGYAWMALYFFALMSKPQWRKPALAIGVLAGGVFGFSQQLRGAHFMSHDVATATLCWLLSTLVYLWWVRLSPPIPMDGANVEATAHV